jgi:hypothetical protein
MAGLDAARLREFEIGGRDAGSGTAFATRRRLRRSATSGAALATSACDGAERWLSGAATTVGLNATGGAPSEYVTSISAA